MTDSRRSILLIGGPRSGKTTYACALCSAMALQGESLDTVTTNTVDRVIWDLQHGSWTPKTPVIKGGNIAKDADLSGIVRNNVDKYLYQITWDRRNWFQRRFGSSPANISLIDCAGEIWDYLANEMMYQADEGPSYQLLSDLLSCNAMMAFIDAVEIRNDPRKLQQRIQRLLALIDVRTRPAVGEQYRPLPVAVLISKGDRDNAVALDEIVNTVNGREIPEISESLYQESLVHLSYFGDRLRSATDQYEVFVVSSLEALRSNCTLTQKQVLKLEPQFTPNGSGRDLIAPLRWCLDQLGR